MIEINLDTLHKSETRVHVKGHKTGKSYVKPHIRVVKAKTADAEMDAKMAALQGYKKAAARTNEWIKNNPEKSHLVGTVNNFTVDEYDDINKYLRGDKPEMLTEDEINNSIIQISEFLADAPKFNGTVYRGMGFDPNVSKDKAVYDDFMKDIENSDVVTLPAFTSTTCKKDIAIDFSGEGVPRYTSRIVLEITSKKGVVLDGAAAFPKEQEILFDKGAEFKIINVVEVDDIKHIKLEEI